MFPLWFLIFVAIAFSAAAPDQRGGHALPSKTVETSSSQTETSQTDTYPAQTGIPSTQSEIEDYLSVVCMENDTWTEPSRPCEIMYAIDYQCLTGLNYNDDADFLQQAVPDCGKNCQSHEFQRSCFCRSQWLESANGCWKCFIAHGGANSKFLTSLDWTGVPDVWDDYCNPLASPTAEFAEYLSPLKTSVEATETSQFSDPLGFKQTDVSLYWTSSLEGKEAWSTTLSDVDDWSGESISSLLSADSTVIVTPVTKGGNHASISAYTPAAIASASGPIIAIFTPTVFSTVWPNKTSSPSLTSSISASHRTGVSGLVGVLSFVAMVVIL